MEAVAKFISVTIVVMYGVRVWIALVQWEEEKARQHLTIGVQFAEKESIRKLVNFSSLISNEVPTPFTRLRNHKIGDKLRF